MSLPKLETCSIISRARRMAGGETPLSEFMTMNVWTCHRCQREMAPSRLLIGENFDIYCIDREKCEVAWRKANGKSAPAPKKKLPKPKVGTGGEEGEEDAQPLTVERRREGLAGPKAKRLPRPSSTKPRR